MQISGTHLYGIDYCDTTVMKLNQEFVHIYNNLQSFCIIIIIKR